MRTAQLPQPVAPIRKPQRLLPVLLLPAFLLFLTVLAALPVASAAASLDEPAKAQKPAASKPAIHKPVRKRGTAKPEQKAAISAASAVVAIPAAPQQPPKPNWPVNDKPTPATIAWNAAGLRIEASNASLQQILKEVSTLTGSAVEGLGSDERVYGVYGPGPVREVLAKLFDGSGYNLLLIGDSGQGTPRQILLTSRDGKSNTAAAKAGKTDDDDTDDVEPEEQPQQPAQPLPGQPPQIRNNMGEPPQGGQFVQPPQNGPQ
jgi:hypothetical protein